MDSESPGGRRQILTLSTAAGLIPLIIYWHTCHRTITWWDSAQYSLAADTLGVAGPPGSLLLTILGWVFTTLPLGISSAFTLNLVAGAIAACTVSLCARVAAELLGWISRDDDGVLPLPAAVAIALGALPLAFGATQWSYAVKFTPYILTAAFTGLILLTLVRWWRVAAYADGLKLLFMTTLLVGLDFSVHRTNALLVPGIVCWILIRRPRVLKCPPAWVAGIAGLATGLSAQLLLIPMAMREPALNMTNPSNLQRLWEYVSLSQFGGGFLFNVFPRAAGFFSVQLRDVLDAVGLSFAATGGTLLFFGGLPALLALYGLAVLWRREIKLGAALTVLFVTTVLTTVFYFNIPENYFRPLHRHYLPCLVIFAVWSAFGAGLVVTQLSGSKSLARRALAWSLLVLIAALVVVRVADNYKLQDRSRNYFAYDFAANLLENLPPNAILLTNGDNDTFPLWYLQEVEGSRSDVEVINVPLTNTTWFIEKVLCAPGGVSFSRPAEEMAAITPIAWETREVVLPGPVDSLRLTIEPTAGSYVLMQDQVILDMIHTNQWQRPVMVATTVSPSVLPWLRDHLSVAGLAFRFVPEENPGTDLEALRANMLERYRFRGYADPSVYVDDTSAAMAQNYIAGFMNLAVALADSAECDDVIAAMWESIPLDRVGASEQMATNASRVCKPRAD